MPHRSTQQSARDITILHVEDDDLEIMSLRRAMKALGLDCRVVSATDGVEALAHLRGEGGREKLRRPYVVLLDINMPRMSGHEFLAELRKDPALERTTVFVLTTSYDPADKCEAYRRHVAGYIVKDDVAESTKRAVALLRDYLSLVELP